MPYPESRSSYKPSREAIEILCERLQHMGVSMSEQAARSLLESVLAVEGQHLAAHLRRPFQESLEGIRNAADAALTSLAGSSSRRDYELSFAPASESVSASGQRRRLAAARVTPPPRREEALEPSEDEPRPVFKRRRGR
jgi:hypothetical protein